MAISLKQIEAFVAVADLGSFRRAAERLNTTQPNISTRISTMEATLGLTLMERDAGSVRLTPKGESMLAHARDVLRGFETFLGSAGDDTLFSGAIRLGVTEMIAHAWLGRFLKALQDQFPNVSVDLSVDLSISLSRALYNRSIDLALQNSPFDRQMSGMIGLGRYPLVWVASPSLGISGRSLEPENLTDYTILTHAKGALPHEQLLQHLADNRVEGARMATSTNLAACQQMTVDGLGISCLPRVMVERDLASQRLELVEYVWAPDDLEFAARYDADTAPSFVRAAAEIAAKVAEKEGPGG